MCIGNKNLLCWKRLRIPKRRANPWPLVPQSNEYFDLRQSEEPLEQIGEPTVQSTFSAFLSVEWLFWCDETAFCLRFFLLGTERQIDPGEAPLFLKQIWSRQSRDRCYAEPENRIFDHQKADFKQIMWQPILTWLDTPTPRLSKKSRCLKITEKVSFNIIWKLSKKPHPTLPA